MTLYVAFLRGINVGGHNLVKMNEIRHKLESLGYDNVSSFRASGNILFKSDQDPTVIVEEIQDELCSLVNDDVKVFLRTSSQIEEIVGSNPFGETGQEAMLYITFIPEEASIDTKIPLLSPKSDVEIILVANGVVFSQTSKYKGRFGTPNKFIETEFKVPATTRNWNTIKGVLEMIHREYNLG